MDQKIIDFIKGLMQPALTLVAIVLLFMMSVSGAFPSGDVFKVVVGIILFWFGYTGIKNFTFTGNGKSNGTTPKANGGTSTATVTGDDSATLPEPVTISPQQVTVFDPADFKARVNTLCDSVISWQKKNPSSLFSAAYDVYWGMNFDNIQAHKDALDALIGYAKESFREIWGLPANVDPITYATEHMNDNLGCMTCGNKTIGCTYPDLEFKARQLGEGYYISLIRLQDFILKRSQLDQV